MMLNLFVVVCVLLACLANAQYNSTVALGAYDTNQAQISLWLSAAAYCGKSAYKTHVFKGPTTGFVLTDIISDVNTDTEGYVGYLPSDKSIYVVYRGSSSIRNWISNLDAFKTTYTSFSECGCQVHKGFYEAEQKVIGTVLTAVKNLRAKYPSYAVKATGHSLGAALAQLTSMDLVKAGYAATLYNFGQPRVGDKKYASFATGKVPTWRVTHNKDTVPHVPYTTGMEFYHECREEFEDASGKVRTCDTSCEDPTCADQYPFAQTNVDDHLVYLGLQVSNCAAVSR